MKSNTSAQLHSETATLYMGAKPSKQVTIVTDRRHSENLKGLTIRNISSNRKNSKFTTVLLKQNELMVYSSKGTSGGISLKNFILGPNYNRRINDDLPYTFTECNFHSAIEPVTRHTLICLLRRVSTGEIGFRYFDVDTRKCETVMSTYNEILSDMQIVDLEPPPILLDWVKYETQPGTRKRKPRLAEEPQIHVEAEEPQLHVEAEEPQQSTATVGMVGADGVKQDIATKTLDVPAGAIPVNVEIKIPIPYTDVFITVSVTTK